MGCCVASKPTDPAKAVILIGPRRKWHRGGELSSWINSSECERETKFDNVRDSRMETEFWSAAQAERRRWRKLEVTDTRSSQTGGAPHAPARKRKTSKKRYGEARPARTLPPVADLKTGTCRRRDRFGCRDDRKKPARRRSIGR